MNKTKQKILIFFLILFSIYCSLSLGQSWDETFHLTQGKITLNYLLSLGYINKGIFMREYYSPVYWSFLYLTTQIFPPQYQIEVSHIVNLTMSLGTVVGIGKLSEELFNKGVGKITLLILFFYPVFFGHMSFNSKDTILAFGHVWITYLLLRYLKKQNVKEKVQVYIFCIGFLAAFSSGIQLVFLGSLIPVILLVFFDIFFAKRFICKNFNLRNFFLDVGKCFLIFYLVLVIFWIDVHPNIIMLPFQIVQETLSSDYWTGWPFNLVNGNYYLSSEIPKSYLLINFFYKSPEYFLISYLLFIILFFNSKVFFLKKFKFFYYKISAITLLLVFPNIILFIIPYPVYDGMRLFLWTIPYFCIMPGITIYYLIENLNLIKQKITFIFLSVFIFYFLFNFFLITPYQYTYLNIFNGKMENRYKKFENDYWGVSIKELLKHARLENDKTIMIASCGINSEISKNYLRKMGYSNLLFVDPDKAEYIIMTNRVVVDQETENNTKKLTNCFEKYKGKNIFEVKRLGQTLSVIRKI